MYFTHSDFTKKTSFKSRRDEDGDIWLELTSYHKLAFSEQEARQVIELLRRSLGDEIDSPPADNPASQYREAYFAGMSDGPAPGAD
jgi:hypothetical protein